MRCIFRSYHDGRQAYEERVTLWHTADIDAGIERAETEARRYAVEGVSDGYDTEYLGFAQGYLLTDDPADGAEIFSLIRDSPLRPDAYLNSYFDSGTERQNMTD